MTVPKHHHYVPQMILDEFTDLDGWLHWCRIEGGDKSVRRARPSKLFHQNHLYSTVSESGIKDPKMEHDLSVLETAAVSVIKAMIEPAREGRLPVLSEIQMRTWYLFFLMQWRRTPESQKAIADDAEVMEMLDDTLQDLRAVVPDRHSEIDTYSTPEAKARIIRNVRVGTLRQLSSKVMGVLERRGIAILRIRRPNKSFIIGSRPVVKFTIAGKSDLNDPTVEMWLPPSTQNVHFEVSMHLFKKFIT